MEPLKPKPIHWQALKKKLQERQKSSELDALRPEEVQRILKIRAEQLKQTFHPFAAITNAIEVIEFTLANETYALEVQYIHEIFAFKEITRLPGTPDFVRGIINVRGQIFSVVDLMKLFKLAESPITKLSKVVILRSPSMEFSILVDRLISTYQIPVEQLKKSVVTLKGRREKYLKGVTSDYVLVLDAEKLLSDPELIVYDV